MFKQLLFDPRIHTIKRLGKRPPPGLKFNRVFIGNIVLTKNNIWKNSITILIVFLSLQSVSWAATNEPVAIPGTTVSMTPPVGFTLSKSFSGFENPSDNSSITIVELPKKAYAKLSQLFHSRESAARFSTKGISIVSQEDVIIAGKAISVLSGTQQVSTQKITKYMALFEGEKTVLIAFNIMDKETTKKAEALAALKSTILSSIPSLKERLALLSFSFQATDPFKISNIILGSSVLLTTFEGSDPSGKLPMAVITRASSAVGSADIANFAEQALRSTNGFSAAKIRVAQSKEFAGHSGFYIEAIENGHLIKQYITIPKDRIYIRLVALGEKGALDNISEQIQSLADSIILK